MRRHGSRISNLQAGLIAIVVIGVLCYLVFGGTLPFAGSGFELKALFTTETQLHIPSPVRIAGVDVGQVTSVRRVSRDSTAAVVTMTIQPNGLPIHADATAKIRPRIFLEGNFYVDLHPGTPNAPTVASGATLPAAHTAGPVQLDRVLSSLNANARTDLQTLLRGLGRSLDGRPTAAADVGQDPITQGLTGGQALNLSLKYSVGAFRGSAIVNQALLGQQPHDLSRVVTGTEQVFRALGARSADLASLVHTFNLTMSTLAVHQQDLGATIAQLPPLLRTADRTLTALDASYRPTQDFARTILPAIAQVDPTIGAALPWIAQATPLMSPQELGGLLRYLTPAIQDTANTIGATDSLLRGSDLLARCFIHNVIPTGNEVIQDPPASTGEQVYQELFQSAVGLAGAAGNFDGNGRYLRTSAGGGPLLVQTSDLPTQGPLFGNAVLTPLGTRPAWAGGPPPLKRSLPCYQNAKPDLNNVRTGAGP